MHGEKLFALVRPKPGLELGSYTSKEGNRVLFLEINAMGCFEKLQKLQKTRWGVLKRKNYNKRTAATFRVLIAHLPPLPSRSPLPAPRSPLPCDA